MLQKREQKECHVTKQKDGKASNSTVLYRIYNDRSRHRPMSAMKGERAETQKKNKTKHRNTQKQQNTEKENN